MFGIKRENKLQVTITDTVTEEKWTLQGRLAWPWVNQLRENWRTTHRTLAPKTCIVDLSGITSVDTIGERMLRSMANDGAQFIVGIDMYRVLECLRNIGSTFGPSPGH